MATAGVSVALNLAWRYADLGEVWTAWGPGYRGLARGALGADAGRRRADVGEDRVSRVQAVVAVSILMEGRGEGWRGSALRSLEETGQRGCRICRSNVLLTSYRYPLSDTGSPLMNKSKIGGRVADRIRISEAAAGDAVDAVFETIAEGLARGEDVRIVGFGALGTRRRPARTGRNLRTGESLDICASTSPTFKHGKPLRDAVNDGSVS